MDNVELLNEEFVNSIQEILEQLKESPLFKFAVIGSRDTEEPINEFLYTLVLRCLKMGAKGYSGGAEGPDDQLTKAVRTALEEKIGYRGYEMASIYPGWYGFNNLTHGDLDGAVADGSKQAKTSQARQLAKALHFAFDKMGPGAQALHARNCFEILTETLNDPVDVVFYTATKYDNAGRPLGGTATAWKLATVLNIPTFDCSKSEGRAAALEWVSERIAGNKEAEDIFNSSVIPHAIYTDVSVPDFSDVDFSEII